jgi:hypothetical protein
VATFSHGPTMEGPVALGRDRVVCGCKGSCPRHVSILLVHHVDEDAPRFLEGRLQVDRYLGEALAPSIWLTQISACGRDHRH